MELTIKFIEKHFDEINKKHFDGKLLKPDFEITHVKCYLGQYHFKYSWDDEKIFRESVIRISDMFDRTEKDVINTLAHEMCHLYIRQNKLRDTRPHHGRIFYSVANRLNREGGFNISRTDSIVGCGLKNKNGKKWLIACFKDSNGRYFSFSINPKYVDSYLEKFKKHSYHFGEYFIFSSDDDKRFSHYPLCRGGVRGHYLDKETFTRYRKEENVIHSCS